MLPTLFLDDCQTRCRRFRSFRPASDIVNDAEECVAALKKGQAEGHHWDIISLDHDLGGQVYADEALPNTGSAVVRFIQELEKPLDVGLFVVHSLNHPAAESMRSKLAGLGYVVYRAPFLDSYFTQPFWDSNVDH